MTALHDRDPDPAALAAARVAEITTLFARIHALLDHSLSVTDKLSAETPRNLITRMDQLIAAHLKLLAAEEAFHAARTDHATGESADAIRDRLGRKLDRLRASLGAAAVSGGAGAG